MKYENTAEKNSYEKTIVSKKYGIFDAIRDTILIGLFSLMGHSAYALQKQATPEVIPVSITKVSEKQNVIWLPYGNFSIGGSYAGINEGSETTQETNVVNMDSIGSDINVNVGGEVTVARFLDNIDAIIFGDLKHVNTNRINAISGSKVGKIGPASEMNWSAGAKFGYNLNGHSPLVAIIYESDNKDVQMTHDILNIDKNSSAQTLKMGLGYVYRNDKGEKVIEVIGTLPVAKFDGSYAQTVQIPSLSTTDTTTGKFQKGGLELKVKSIIPLPLDWIKVIGNVDVKNVVEESTPDGTSLIETNNYTQVGGQAGLRFMLPWNWSKGMSADIVGGFSGITTGIVDDSELKGNNWNIRLQLNYEITPDTFNGPKQEKKEEPKKDETKQPEKKKESNKETVAGDEIKR